MEARDMLRVLLVDDERGAREKLRRLLDTTKTKVDIIEAANGMSAVEQIKKFEPELVFLDIKMPGLSGFDVLCHFNDREFAVVFQTAYDEFAVKAFEENALDYLLKPIGQERFDKFWTKFCSNKQNMSKETLDKLAEAGMKLKKISVKIGQKLKVFPVDQIYYFRSVDRFVRLYTEDANYSCNFTLDSLETKVDSNFIRIHRSCLVNKNVVESVLLQPNSTKLKLKNGDELEVARSKRQYVKSLFTTS